LNVTGRDGALVAHAIAMIDGSGQHVRNGLDAAMRMPGETFEVVLGVLVAEVIEEEEGIEVSGFAEAEGALEADACAFEGWFGRQNFSNWPE
jgi:hypothetical protein